MRCRSAPGSEPVHWVEGQKKLIPLFPITCLSHLQGKKLLCATFRPRWVDIGERNASPLHPFQGRGHLLLTLVSAVPSEQGTLL